MHQLTPPIDRAFRSQVYAPALHRGATRFWSPASFSENVRELLRALLPEGRVVLRVAFALLVAGALGFLLTATHAARVLTLKAFAVGIAGGVAGGLVAGGIGLVTVPLIVLVLGFPIHLAVGTNLFQSVLTGASGAWQHGRLGNVNFKLAKPLLLGAAVGGPAGALVSLALPEVALFWIFSVAIFAMAAVVLRGLLRRDGGTGDVELPDLLPERLRQGSVEAAGKVAGEKAAEAVRKAVDEPIEGDFRGHRYRVDRVTPVLLGVAVGFVSGLLGVSGGFLFTPLLANMLAVPTHLAVGTGLVVLTGNSVFSTVAHLANGTVIVVAGTFIGLGGFVGASLGSRLGNRLSERTLNVLFLVMLVVVGLKMLPVGPL